MHDTKLFGDNRPKKGSWAPGNYYGKCDKCNVAYSGDKRSRQCADCAYREKPRWRYNWELKHWHQVPSQPVDHNGCLIVEKDMSEPCSNAKRSISGTLLHCGYFNCHPCNKYFNWS